VSPVEIFNVRTGLGLSQVQFAQLLGVHPLTVSKWERGLLVPTHHHLALIKAFSDANSARKGVGDQVASLLLTAGLVAALYVLFEAALGE
jgi:transcriptional regulator with XRE-family HTH domain